MQNLLTFLGTSDAQGVPRMLCRCPVCTSSDPIHKRRRPSVRFETEDAIILIDVSPDFREQFLQYGNELIPDAVLITHCHNDHIAGFGDFGDLCFWNKKRSRIISPEENIRLLRSCYSYLNESRGIEYNATDAWKIGKWQIRFHRVNHGFNGFSYGIRFHSEEGAWAYVPDAFGMTEEQLEPFTDMDLLVLGTSYYREHADRTRRSVYDVTEAIEIKEKVRPSRLLLTHLSHDIDIPLHSLRLPPGIQFAYDGMQLAFPF